jgi:glutamate racemase
MVTVESTAKPIGVFDSGIGGLTVVRALAKKLPRERIVYFGDTARVPYGPKSTEVVKQYAVQDAAFLMTKDVKMIVVACNTVSAVAIDEVKSRFSIPVLGVIEPGARAAVRATKNKKVGVIGTLGTIASCAYTNAIHHLDPSIEVAAQACPMFVSLAEEGFSDHAATELIAEEYLKPLVDQHIDTLVLGCTHYPLLKRTIQKVVGSRIKLIDSAESTASDVEELLIERKLLTSGNGFPRHEFYVSDLPHRFRELGERFFGEPLHSITKVDGFPV